MERGDMSKVTRPMVLDDTGKSLVLQKVAMSMLDELPVLGSHLHKQGYIHEIKSALSEFMQYGIAPHVLLSIFFVHHIPNI